MTMLPFLFRNYVFLQKQRCKMDFGAIKQYFYFLGSEINGALTDVRLGTVLFSGRTVWWWRGTEARPSLFAIRTVTAIAAITAATICVAIAIHRFFLWSIKKERHKEIRFIV